jgi:hypothetical protein
MDVDLNSLPDDASLPKDIVISLLDSVEIKYQEKIHHLEEQLRLFKNELFGRTSERRHEPHPDQMPLFNVAMMSMGPRTSRQVMTQSLLPPMLAKSAGARPYLKICRALILSMILAKMKSSVPAGHG